MTTFLDHMALQVQACCLSCYLRATPVQHTRMPHISKWKEFLLGHGYVNSTSALAVQDKHMGQQPIACTNVICSADS